MKTKSSNINQQISGLISNKLESILCGIFGYHALLYTHYAKALVKKHINIKHSVVLVDESFSLIQQKEYHQTESHLSLKCDFKELPISSDSIDLVVLPEVLNQSENPHQVLREVERVLIPEGYIVLIIANPYSWLNVKQQLLGVLKGTKQHHTQLSRLRVSDWFRLLGLEITAEHPICSWDPLEATSIDVNNHKDKKAQLKDWAKNTVKLGFNAVSNHYARYCATYYIIVAKKKVSTLTPIRESWRKNAKLVRPRLAEPSVSQQVDRCIIQIKG